MIQEGSCRAWYVSFLFVLISIVIVLSSHPLAQTSIVQSNASLFLPATTYPSGGVGPYSAVAADFNGDHKPDLATANFQSGTVGVLLGNGDGTFQNVVSYGPASAAFAVAAADLNRDGKLDLVVANAGSNSVGVLLGNGDGTFQPIVNYYAGARSPLSLAVADVNHDGNADVLVLDCGISTGCGGGSNAAVAILMGNGDGTLRLGNVYDAGAGGYSLTVADLNGDGYPDVAVADCGANIFCPASAPGLVSILLGNGDGTLQPAVAYDAGGRSTMGIAIADVNGDGKPDLLAANMMSNTLSVLLGNGDGTFRSATTYGAGGNNPTAIAVADVDGDGKLDLLSANYGSDTVSVLLGNGDGTFQLATAYNSGGHGVNSVAVADVNGDGRPDVVVPNIYDNTVGILLNASTATDVTPPVIALAVTPKVLRPPTGQMVPVSVFGKITDTGSGYKPGSAEYSVQDEYKLVQPFGKITLDSAGNYSFTVLLKASREQSDADGRQYNIRVSAKDNAGNRGAKWARVTVPHGD